MGCGSVNYPLASPMHRMNRQSKDWSSTEFHFSSISHTLGVKVQKENPMSTIAIALFLFVRVVIPFGLLIAIGEWVRRREINYWFKM